MKRTRRRNGINGIQMRSHTENPPRWGRRESFNSQQHVLLILLEDGADVLEDVWGKEVYAAVYDVAHKRARLFHVVQHLSEKHEEP